MLFPFFVHTTEADSFMLKTELLESKITKKTKALILNSPSNPTGFIYDRKALEAIAAIAVKHNIYVIADEFMRSSCMTVTNTSASHPSARRLRR